MNREKYINEYGAQYEPLFDMVDALEDQLEAVNHKVDAYDAMCEVGLIQFDPNIPNHVYSVWGFTCWHHDEDILKAIAAANEPVKVRAFELKTCEHGQGMTEYCEPCGRTHGSDTLTN